MGSWGRSGAKVVLSWVLLLYTYPAIVSTRVPLCRLNYRCRGVVLYLFLELSTLLHRPPTRARESRRLSLTLYTPFVHPYPFFPLLCISLFLRRFHLSRSAQRGLRRHLNTKVSPWLTVRSFNVASGCLTAQLLPLASTERQSDLYGRRFSTRRHFARWQLLPPSSYPYGRETHISSLSQNPPRAIPPLHYIRCHATLYIPFSMFVQRFYLLHLHIASIQSRGTSVWCIGERDYLESISKTGNCTSVGTPNIFTICERRNIYCDTYLCLMNR